MKLTIFAQIIINHLKTEYPCTCHPGYKGMKRIDPTCTGCELIPEYEDIRKLAIQNSKADDIISLCDKCAKKHNIHESLSIGIILGGICDMCGKNIDIKKEHYYYVRAKEVK